LVRKLYLKILGLNVTAQPTVDDSFKYLTNQLKKKTEEFKYAAHPKSKIRLGVRSVKIFF
jgi:hypothetical protein